MTSVLRGISTGRGLRGHLPMQGPIDQGQRASGLFQESPKWVAEPRGGPHLPIAAQGDPRAFSPSPVPTVCAGRLRNSALDFSRHRASGGGGLRPLPAWERGD